MRDAQTPLTDGESLALFALRRAGGCPRRCPAAGVPATGIEYSLAGTIGILRDLFTPPPNAASRQVRFGLSGSLVITKDERRLLLLIAAAQAEDFAWLDHYLCRLTVDQTSRARMTAAMASLAACLAVHGYWLARRTT